MKNLKSLVVAGMIGLGSFISEGSYGQRALSEDVFPRYFAEIPIDSAEYIIDNSNKKPNFFQINVYLSNNSKTCYYYDKLSKHEEIIFFDDKGTKIINNQISKKDLKDAFKFLREQMRFCYSHHRHPKKFILKNTKNGIFYPSTFRQSDIRIPWF